MPDINQINPNFNPETDSPDDDGLLNIQQVDGSLKSVKKSALGGGGGGGGKFADYAYVVFCTFDGNINWDFNVVKNVSWVTGISGTGDQINIAIENGKAIDLCPIVSPNGTGGTSQRIQFSPSTTQFTFTVAPERYDGATPVFIGIIDQSEA